MLSLPVKKIILLIIVFLISINILHADEFKWSDVMISKDKTSEFYIDKKSIKRIDNYIYYWSLGNYLILEESENQDVKSVIVYNRIDCNDFGYQIVIFTAYENNMGRGKALYHDMENPDKEEEKRFDSKDSMAYDRHKELCN